MTDLAPPIPILRSANEAQSRAFYLDYLGFSVVFAHRFAPDLPLYLAVKRGSCEIHLSEHLGDAAPGSAMRIAVDDVHALCAALNAKPLHTVRPRVQRQPFGFDDLDITDPSGNRLTFCTALDPSA